jgi:hypothetical protein
VLDRITWIAKSFDKLVEESKIVLAAVAQNNILTPVTIEYEQTKIVVCNLAGDFPPFVCIQNDGKAEGSFDRTKWLRFSDDEISELQAFRLLDPRFILPHIQTGSESTEKRSIINGSYPIEKLGLPSIVRDYFKELKIVNRWVCLHAFEDYLLSMTQHDFPPFLDSIKVIFTNPFWPNLYPFP